MRKVRALFVAAAVALAISVGSYHAYFAASDACATVSAGDIPHLTRWGPTTASDGVRHPAVLLLHGGAGPIIFEKAPDYRRYPEALAAAGYVVVMPYYWDASSGPEETARAVITWMQKQPEIDPARIAVAGFSAGGFTATATAVVDARVAAAVIVYGGLHDGKIARVAHLPPTLILHGADDESVPVAEAYALEKILKANHAAYELHVYEHQDHGFNGEALDDSVTRIVTFLNAQMKR